MAGDHEDDTAVPLLANSELEDFIAGKHWPHDQTAQGHLIQRASAEMNRRLFRSQIKALEAQRLQLEAQGSQNATQLEVARSLKSATWVLSGATILLAVATVFLVVATIFHHS